MTYIITHQSTLPEVYSTVDNQEKRRAFQKLVDIATSEYREPWQWDFDTIRSHEADGRFRVGDDLRVFVSVDRGEKVINIHSVARRENLY